LNFINLSLFLLAPQDAKIPDSKFPLPDYARKLDLHITESKKHSPEPLNVSAFLTDKLGRGAIDSEQARISLLIALLKVLEAYMELYNSTTAFVETFEPSLTIVQEIAGAADWNRDVKVPKSKNIPSFLVVNI
jgi:hypothetical protein